MDYEKEMDRVTEELLQLRHDQEVLEDEIEQLLRRGLQLPKEMRPSLNRLARDVGLAQTSLDQLSSSMEVSCALADGICGKIREMDTAKNRVVECLQLIEDLLDLRACTQGLQVAMANDDYEQAAAYVHRFLNLDPAVSAASHYLPDSAAADMDRAADRLSALILQRFDEAVERDDMASAQRFFKLFPLLKQHQLGVQKFAAYLATIIRKTNDANYRAAIDGQGTDPGRANVLFADALTLLLEGVARVLEVQQPVLDAYYGADRSRLLDLWVILQGQCDVDADRMFDSFADRRNLNTIVKLTTATAAAAAVAERVDPLELDVLLTEMTLMQTRADMYFRFVHRRLATEQCADLLTQHVRDCRLNRRCQEMLGCYISLEEYYMRQSIQKAVKLEYRDHGALCSSLADDVFFIVRKSIRRAMSGSNVDCVCAVLNYACNLLQSDYFGELKARLKPSALAYSGLADAYASVVQPSKLVVVADGGGSEKAVDDFLVGLNNCNASVDCLEQLTAGLSADFAGAFGDRLTAKDRGKLDSCLTQFDEVGRRCRCMVRDGLAALVRQCVRPKLKQAVDSFYADTHSPGEFEFGQVEARNVFVETMVCTLTGLGDSYKAKLAVPVHRELLTLLIAETTDQLEKAIMKGTYNRLGGILLDKQIRELAHFWTNLCGWSAREKFSKLNQIASLLNVDSVEEAKEFCQSDSVVWLLSAPEIRQVLALRIDLPGSEIRTIRA